MNKFLSRKQTFNDNKASTSAQASIAPKIKPRKYYQEYLNFELTIAEVNGEEKPMCVICSKILAADSMKPNKLKRHLETLHVCNGGWRDGSLGGKVGGGSKLRNEIDVCRLKAIVEAGSRSPQSLTIKCLDDCKECEYPKQSFIAFFRRTFKCEKVCAIIEFGQIEHGNAALATVHPQYGTKGHRFVTMDQMNPERNSAWDAGSGQMVHVLLD
ncbi:hypothetical protein TNCV_4798761 [Trichonephila clavipes]|nr:hypothetical protein TNCV_4798761 [Trichonephila clavipes]